MEWRCKDEEALENFGVKLAYEDMEFTVEGLEEARIVDPFENIQVSFTGLAPFGEVHIENQSTEGFLRNLNFQCENTGDLSNGDTVTVKIKNYGDEVDVTAYISEGILLSETSKEYVVEGLGSYIRNMEELSEEVIESMKKQAQDDLLA